MRTTIDGAMRRSRFIGHSLPALATLALLAACGATPPPAAVVAPAPKPAAPAKTFDPAQRVKWYQDCWGYFNDKKWDDFAKCYAPDASSRQAGYGSPAVTGVANILAASKDLATMAPDVSGQQQLILVNNGRLASISVLHGTNTGPMKDPTGAEMKPTGKRFGAWFGHSIEVDTATETVTREFGVSDSTTLAAQLGMIKAPVRPVMSAPKAPATVVIAANDAKEAANIAAERAEVSGWNRHDPPLMDKYLAPKYIQHVIGTAKDENQAASDESNEVFWRGFGDARLDARYWAAGDYVVIDGTFEGTNNGDFTPLKASKTGKKVTAPFLEIDRFVDAKIAEAWLFYDTGTFATQLAPPASK